ncbi:alpha/beta hydrolase [Rathayibacter iranicus]|uniref:Acetyl esterase/lipase n=1 Tax=Rathayibacter iranicus NCPPB 2253 = VKM Ac-1602 TaxID=1328868 RepID=A0ABX5LDV1_9MICO|nr:alpha/beta hydrolase [Rathayibacter iranicus]MWV32183.1 alpha/beta hydrolase fold domain-containing protein [Rathayibacter iranicus NCPPB 2253 = VKM Ac-1602]PWJ61705.1 acetyl esterase/lipase [Rathayibacter iranicus] [Rathayibacter iranicus NCPPB 2253 = VKM Ac-1602]
MTSIRARRAGVLAAIAAVALGLTGCTAPPEPSRTPDGFTTQKAIEYRSVDGVSLKADACLPTEGDAGRPALLMLHGGGFVDGARNEGGMTELCEYYAKRGFVSVTFDYRLLQQSRYPGQIEDAQAAVEWLRDPAQVERFGLDPARIGVLGSSAGAIIGATLGTLGEGSLTEGSRVKTVVAFSAVADMTEAGMSLGTPLPEAKEQILAYLGCKEIDDSSCPQSVEASPLSSVDPTDAPQIWLTSEDELVPVEQADAMQVALQDAGVESEVGIDGSGHHGLQNNTPNNKKAILAFLQATL